MVSFAPKPRCGLLGELRGLGRAGWARMTTLLMACRPGVGSLIPSGQASLTAPATSESSDAAPTAGAPARAARRNSVLPAGPATGEAMAQ